ncbi:unnamed protein product, partial [Ilex paraguariensis]
ARRKEILRKWLTSKEVIDRVEVFGYSDPLIEKSELDNSGMRDRHYLLNSTNRGDDHQRRKYMEVGRTYVVAAKFATEEA